MMLNKSTILTNKKEYFMVVKVLILVFFIGTIFEVENLYNQIDTLKFANTIQSKQNIELLDVIDKYEQTVDAIDLMQSNHSDELKDIRLRLQNLDYIDRNEKSILTRIVEAEATGGTIQQKINVAKCIINRMHSNKFPDTIHGVVFQGHQFQPTFDGRYYSVKVQADTIKAVEIAMKRYREDNSGNLYFMARSSSQKRNVKWFDSKLNFIFNDGIHDHFKEK